MAEDLFGEEDEEDFKYESWDELAIKFSPAILPITDASVVEKIAHACSYINGTFLNRIEVNSWREWDVSGVLVSLANRLHCHSSPLLTSEGHRLYQLLGDHIVAFPAVAEHDIDLLSKVLMVCYIYNIILYVFSHEFH